MMANSESLDEFTADTNRIVRAAEARLQRADARGTGCHLTAEMVRALCLGVIGESSAVKE
jgi:hypothetical protein